MTAEVAILNGQCVVMATDSAVTTGNSKVFNTVNKLFALNKQEPVGIMVYSSAEVMGVPIETVVKEFRRVNENLRCDHLEGYSDAFLDFLVNDDKTLFDTDARERSLKELVNYFFMALSERASDKMSDLNTGWGHPTEIEARQALEESLSELEESVKNTPEIKVLKKVERRRLIAAVVEETIVDNIKVITRLMPLSPAIQNRIRRLAVSQLFKCIDFGGETGFVIAGFGKDDIFPRLRAFEFSCAAYGLNKVKKLREIDISRDHTAEISPYAQKDVMTTFVEGKDRLYNWAIDSYITGFFEEQEEMLNTADPPMPHEAKLVKDIGVELKSKLQSRMARLTRERFIRPLMDAVEVMPKEELAILAENLINLTALKRKASQDTETVGGPTDVAVISKGDGFIWIKRKHYFDPALNPAFNIKWTKGGQE